MYIYNGVEVPVCYFYNPPERETEKDADIVRKLREGDKSRQKRSCGLSHFHQCVCLPLQMNGRCYKVGY